MKIFLNDAHEHKFNIIDLFYDPYKVVLFDIETTGFTPLNSLIYMIGCAYYEDGKWCIKQWFNDDNQSEKAIIEDFLLFIKDYEFLFNYNGDGFDIPYIENKLKQHNLTSSLDNIKSIDLYKKIKSLKNILKLDNLKQKTLEGFLGIKRLDKYSGGDLIKVYTDYVENPTENKLKLLIQHNYDDLEGLMYCYCLESYLKLKEGNLNVTKMTVINKKLCLCIKLLYPIPKRISLIINDIIITGKDFEATINIPIFSGELFFFFDNYNDYYYLPIEDRAIHKSVASYVDKNYRQAATKENCYTKQNGHFISQIDSGILTGYKKNYKDKESFIELSDSFLKDMDLINKYACYIINLAFNKKEKK